MRFIQSKKQWVDDYNKAKSLTGDLEVLLEFHAAGEVTDAEIESQYNKALDLIEKMEFKNMLSEEGDELPAVLQITAGAGGTESCDWAAMLMRMYMMWAEKNGVQGQGAELPRRRCGWDKNSYFRNRWRLCLWVAQRRKRSTPAGADLPI